MKTDNRHFFLLTASAIALFALVTAPANAQPAPAADVRASVTAGQLAPAFHLQSINGPMINFPADYKGKVVLLDFWATWCGPCRRELPNVVADYAKYHTNGFEIVGVSLDQPRVGPALLQFLKDNQMPWPQIYDGGYWKSAVAVEYGVDAIPCPVLVDGDSGKILAVGADALGSRLTKLLEPALAAKHKP